MRRRDFITLAGGAVTVPLGARAQQNERIKRVGVLQPFAKDGPESARITAFLSELQGLGWTDGRNLEVEYRWQPRDFREAARELVAFSADVILVSTTPAVSAAQQTTRTIPVVFTQVADPVSAGIVASLAKPGGNTANFEGSNSIVGSFLVQSATPLPAALPLFATGLGALGLLGWRRKKKEAAPVTVTKPTNRISERPPRGGLSILCRSMSAIGP